MPTTVANDKGLFATDSDSRMPAHVYEGLKLACGGAPRCKAWVESLRPLLKLENTHWKSDVYPSSHNYTLSLMPGGYSNETQLWDERPQDLRASWSSMLALRKEWESVSKLLAKADWPEAVQARALQLGLGELGDAILTIDHILPKKAALEKALACNFTDLAPGWEAEGGDAYAIWMGSARELGYMDDKKRPAGAASARLFESAAAASRTAKAARFGVGGSRGPAAIVKLAVEPVDILFAQGSSGEAPRSAISELEAAEISAALEEASPEEIAQALGGEQPAMPAPPQIGRAGCQLGYASWIDRPKLSEGPQGFVNIRSELGPLTSAVLSLHEHFAHSKTGAGGCVVKVALRPVEIMERLGAPKTSGLEACIAWEAESARRAALAKQTGQALRERAAALQSGASAPRVRSSRL